MDDDEVTGLKGIRAICFQASPNIIAQAQEDLEATGVASTSFIPCCRETVGVDSKIRGSINNDEAPQDLERYHGIGYCDR